MKYTFGGREMVFKDEIVLIEDSGSSSALDEGLARIAGEIAEEANDCCNRMDGYEERLKSFALERIKSFLEANGIFLEK